VHAAAVVICREPLHNYTPVKYDTKGGSLITQYEGQVVADLGLLKMDFLGLRNLTVIEDALRMIEANVGTPLKIEDLDLAPAGFQGLAGHLQTGNVVDRFEPASKTNSHSL